jgi:hypothetical protein
METQTETRPIPWETRLRYDAFVIGSFILALLAGWALKSWVEGKATTFSDRDAALSLAYPASWAPQAVKGTLLSIRDLRSEGRFKSSFSVAVRELEAAGSAPVQDMVEPFTEERGEELTAYRVLEVRDMEVDGVPAVSISYAYIDEPSESPFQTSLPVVVHGTDVLVSHGTRLYVFTFAAPATTFAQQAGTLDWILASVDLQE